jgi:hypothetical protein
MARRAIYSVGCRYLEMVDVPHCHARRRLLSSVKEQEAAVARALGVAMVYTHPQHLLDERYLAFLQRAAAAGRATRRHPAVDDVQEVPLFVQVLECQGGQEGTVSCGGSSTGATASSEQGAPTCSLDEAKGLVTVGVGVGGDALLRGLQRLGPRAAATIERCRKQRRELDLLRTQASSYLPFIRVRLIARCILTDWHGGVGKKCLL